jgi:hypothetical protein
MSGHFDGYIEVHRKDEVAVMEALMRHGPLAVGVDASFDEFLFYRWGQQLCSGFVNTVRAGYWPVHTWMRCRGVLGVAVSWGCAIGNHCMHMRCGHV